MDVKAAVASTAKAAVAAEEGRGIGRMEMTTGRGGMRGTREGMRGRLGTRGGSGGGGVTLAAVRGGGWRW